MNDRPLRVLALFRGDILVNQGTPIRVRSLLSKIEDDERFHLTVASRSVEAQDCFKYHVTLTKDHVDDLKQLRTYIKQHNIDILVGHTMSASYYMLPLKFLTGVKLFLEMHGFIEEEAREYNSIGWLAYYRMKIWNAIFFFFCDFAVTCSKSITDIIAKYNKNVVSLTGGVDTTHFNPNAPSGGFVKKDSNIIIGYIGDARKWQGLPFLHKAFIKLREEDPHFKLVILTSERNKIPEGDGIEIYDALPHEKVPTFMVDCDILVIPRLLTPVTKISYPSKLTEYLAMGKAVVVSDMGDADQVIENGVNGVIYPPGNMDAFVEKMLLLKDKNTRVELGRRAYETAEHMTWDHLSKRFSKYLLQLRG